MATDRGNPVNRFVEPVTSGTNIEKNINMPYWASGWDLIVRGAGTATIESKGYGVSDYVELTTMTAEALIFDQQNRKTLRITAAGGDITVEFEMRYENVSTPDDSWRQFPANTTP